MKTDASHADGRWREAWPDALGFGGGLALAWFAGWNTTDLIWSLWLSSLVVGYATIVWLLFSRMRVHQGSGGTMAATVLGGLFLLAFFTVHFGMFHFVHSVFLQFFFPVTPGTAASIQPIFYGEVVNRYWYFLPLAILAERQAFRPPPTADKNGRMPKAGAEMMAPYKNVIRLHLLIFFFAAAHFAKLDSFLVYAVVYAVYFFPWRLVFREKSAAA